MTKIDTYLETLYIQENVIFLNEIDLQKIFKNILEQQPK